MSGFPKVDPEEFVRSRFKPEVITEILVLAGMIVTHSATHGPGRDREWHMVVVGNKEKGLRTLVGEGESVEDAWLSLFRAMVEMERDGNTEAEAEDHSEQSPVSPGSTVQNQGEIWPRDQGGSDPPASSPSVITRGGGLVRNIRLEGDLTVRKPAEEEDE